MDARHQGRHRPGTCGARRPRSRRWPLTAGLAAGFSAMPALHAELIIRNAQVWTADPQRPAAEVVVIADGRIAAVGGEELTAAHPGAQVLDAGGRRVIPGMADCHTHIVSGGLGLQRLLLRDAASRAEFIEKIRAYAARLGPEDWIVGRGWTVESWTPAESPTRQWIDAACGGRPAFLARMDGHQVLVNTAALERAGIGADTPDPPGGIIERDAAGAATGILKDAAIELVARKMPPPSTQQRQAALRAAMALFNQLGVTMVHDMSEPSDEPIFDALAQAGALTVRIHAFCQTGEWARLPWKTGPRPASPGAIEWRPAGFKAYMDGSLGSRTAYMKLPYNDNPPDEAGNRGLLMEFALRSAPGDMLSQFRAAAAQGLQPAIHAIGDQANHLLLNAYETLLSEFPHCRPRIEHVQHLLPEDIPRFGRLGVIASMQPLHKADDGRYAEQRLGAGRCASSYAFRGLLDSGAVLCFGSDWPVVDNNPMLGIHAAVTGLTLDGQPFVTEQNLTVEQALHCYTANAARACGREAELGMIKPGYLADLVVLDPDPLRIPPEQLATVRCVLTLVGGREVWRDPAMIEKHGR